jgi:hypothetical protein
MNLKTVTLLAAIMGALSVCTSVYQYVAFLAHANLQENISSVIAWPVGILAYASLTLFLFVLFFRQKSKA